jgi:hypothetical protein
VPTVLKSGSLSVLEPSGPVKACNGIALPLNGNAECEIVSIKVITFMWNALIPVLSESYPYLVHYTVVTRRHN